MNKAMYASVEDARRGKITGKKFGKNPKVKSKKVESVSEETVQAAKDRLAELAQELSFDA